jgi:hypothetical protein
VNLINMIELSSRMTRNHATQTGCHCHTCKNHDTCVAGGAAECKQSFGIFGVIRHRHHVATFSHRRSSNI